MRKRLRYGVGMTNDTKHTPGPWTAEATENTFSVSEIGGPLLYLLTNPRRGSNEANARLIAAAPELLEELRLALSTLRAFEVMPDQQKRIKRVIAQATGNYSR
jgi:hypothetical protein